VRGFAPVWDNLINEFNQRVARFTK
jgi:hypothetical protein